MENKFFRALLFILLLFVTLEGVLRIQQILGPLYDLEFPNLYIDIQALSDTVNHKPTPRDGYYQFEPKDLIPAKALYDELSTRRYHLNVSPNDENRTTVLFLGDSFMQGLSYDVSVPNFMVNILKNRNLNDQINNITFINAATSSYSPIIHTVLAKQLIPVLTPDYLVISLDETDLYDDVVRYKELAVKDSNGNILKVRADPNDMAFLKGLAKVKSHFFFLSRFFLKFYHTRIYMAPRLQKVKDNRPFQIFDYSELSEEEALERYADIISFFESSLGELMNTAIDLMGDKSRILITIHPHRKHLTEDPEDRWNTVVQNSIKKITSQKGVALFNATEDLKKSFGSDLENFYVAEDMHYNESGLKKWAESLIDPLIATMKK